MWPKQEVTKYIHILQVQEVENLVVVYLVHICIFINTEIFKKGFFHAVKIERQRN